MQPGKTVPRFFPIFALPLSQSSTAMTHFNRAVLHLDLDAFYVAVESLRSDALRGPIAIC
ncbi:MAG: hypothetical protein R3D58_02785 [Saprospiraceae bacterium]